MKKDKYLYGIFFLGRFLKGSLSAESLYLKILYQYKMGKKLNLKNPQSYNEKLQWMKLYDRNLEYTRLVDKYEVKEYVTEMAGMQYTIPTLGVWNHFDEIDFASLPNTFVLKCTHDSGGLIIVKDKSKLDKEKAKRKIEHCLKRDYYLNLREWPYKNVPHKIIAEEYIGDLNSLPTDYKFFCFDGKIDSVMLCMEREKGRPKFAFFDMNWQRLLYQKDEPEFEKTIDKPENFDEMIALVKKLCKGFPEVRVDLYNVDGKPYFGEMTFFNQSGFDVDITEQTDLYWGRKLRIKQLENV